MSLEIAKTEFPYVVKIETANGETNVPVAFLTAEQVVNLLQSDFRRLVEEAGAKGARIHVERAPTPDYEAVLHDIAAYLRPKPGKAA